MDTRTLPTPGPTTGSNGAAPPAPDPAASVAAITDITTDIASDAQTLVEEHGNLLKAELKEVGVQASRAAVLFAAGAVGLAIGLLFVLIGLVRLTVDKTALPEWAAWLLWGGGLAVVAGACAVTAGVTLSKLDLLPRRTLRSLLESWSCLVNRLK